MSRSFLRHQGLRLDHIRERINSRIRTNNGVPRNKIVLLSSAIRLDHVSALAIMFVAARQFCGPVLGMQNCAMSGMSWSKCQIGRKTKGII